MRFELPIILALVAQLAQSSPVLDNNLQARTVEDGRKSPLHLYLLLNGVTEYDTCLDDCLTRVTVKNHRHPNDAERQECTDYCAKKHPGRVPGRQSKVKPEQRAH
ncbi:hypothetical protein ACKVWM_001499 [Pyricularia oryzae]